MAKTKGLAEGADREVLGAVFAARISLAKRTREQAAEDARKEHDRAHSWIVSPNAREKSFLWFCAELGLNPEAVRRAVGKPR